MCLMTIDPPRKSHPKRGKAWQVYPVWDDGPRTHITNTPVPIGKWQATKPGTLRLGWGGDLVYTQGFHLFPTRKSAREFIAAEKRFRQPRPKPKRLKLFRVEWRGFICSGTVGWCFDGVFVGFPQHISPCMVVKHRRVLKAVR